MDIFELLFELLRAGLFDARLSDASAQLLKNEEYVKKVFLAAKKHDIAHLVSYSLDKKGLLDMQSAVGQKCLNEQAMAVYRYENINYELQRICKTLDEAEIPFILLKGSVIRRYYPEPWMRTSCDIDILVKEDIVEKAKDLLVEKLKYVFGGKGNHDIQLYSPSDVHLELHYSLLGDDTISEASDTVLKKIWEYIVKEDGYDCCYRFNDAMFLYYHLIHMAKHIKHGGCGIKPFLDMYILNKKIEVGQEAKALLAEGGLEKIYGVSSKLSKIYFAGETHDSVTKVLSDYILGGGVYGNTENFVAMSRSNTGGVLKYALSRIFSPYRILKYRYPELQQKKWLFVPYQFRRWFDLVFKEDAKKSLKELEINKNTSSEKIDAAAKMWSDLGL